MTKLKRLFIGMLSLLLVLPPNASAVPAVGNPKTKTEQPWLKIVLPCLGESLNDTLEESLKQALSDLKPGPETALPRTACIHRLAMTIARKPNRLDESEYLLRHCLQQNTNSQINPAYIANCHFDLGLLYLDSARPTEALPELLHALQAFETPCKDTLAQADTQFALGMATFQLDRTKDAESRFKAAADLYLKSNPTKTNSAVKSLYNAAVAAMKHNDIAAATALLKQAISQCNDCGLLRLLHFRYADLCYKLGDYQQCRETLKACLSDWRFDLSPNALTEDPFIRTKQPIQSSATQNPSASSVASPMPSCDLRLGFDFSKQLKVDTTCEVIACDEPIPNLFFPVFPERVDLTPRPTSTPICQSHSVEDTNLSLGHCAAFLKPLAELATPNLIAQFGSDAFSAGGPPSKTQGDFFSVTGQMGTLPKVPDATEMLNILFRRKVIDTPLLSDLPPASPDRLLRLYASLLRKTEDNKEASHVDACANHRIACRTRNTPSFDEPSEQTSRNPRAHGTWKEWEGAKEERLGKLAIELGDFSSAKKYFEAALKENPGDESIQQDNFWRLSEIYIKLASQPGTSTEESVHDLHLALYYNPESTPARALLDKAVKKLGKNPLSAKDRLELARTYRSSMQLRDAQIEYQESLELKDDPTVWQQLGDIYRVQGSDKKALEAYLHALSAENNETVLIRLCDLYLAMERQVEAVQVIGDAIKKYPNSVDVRDSLVNAWQSCLRADATAAQNHVGMGQAFMFASDSDQAAAECKLALLLDPKNEFAGKVLDSLNHGKETDPTGKSAQLQALIDVGVDLQMSGAYDKAIKLYKHAIKLDNKCAVAWFNLGTAYQRKKDFDEATDAYKRVLSIDPKFGGVKAALQTIEKERHTTELSKIENNTAAAHAPQSAESTDKMKAADAYEIAVVQYKRANYGEAANSCKIAARLQPADPFYPYALGLVFQASGQTSEAINSIKRAIHLAPNNTEYKATLKLIEDTEMRNLCADALMAAASKKPQSALPMYKKLLQWQPKDAQIWCDYGMVLSDLKRFDESIMALKKCTSLDATYKSLVASEIAIIKDSHKGAKRTRVVRTMPRFGFMPALPRRVDRVPISSKTESQSQKQQRATTNPTPENNTQTLAMPADVNQAADSNSPNRDRPVAAQQDVDFGPYMADLQRRIKRAWFPPRHNLSDRTIVVFKVHRGGEITHLRLDRSAGYELHDKAGLKAVENAAPFRPLPAGAPENVDIQFTFDYNVFSVNHPSVITFTPTSALKLDSGGPGPSLIDEQFQCASGDSDSETSTGPNLPALPTKLDLQVLTNATSDNQVSANNSSPVTSDAKEHNNNGVRLGFKKQWPDALREHELAVIGAPSYLTFRTNLSHAHLLYGDELAKQKDLLGALKQYRLALYVDPLNTPARNHSNECLQLVCMRVGKDLDAMPARQKLAEDAEESLDVETALVEYRSCATIDNNGPNHYELGKALLKFGNMVAAFDELRTAAVQFWKPDSESRKALSECHRQLGDILSQYAETASINGNNDIWRKRLTNAAIEYRRAITLNPGDKHSVVQLMEIATKAIAINPTFDNYLTLGSACLLSGDIERAKSQYDMCEKLDPENFLLPEIRRNWDRIANKETPNLNPADEHDDRRDVATVEIYKPDKPTNASTDTQPIVVNELLFGEIEHKLSTGDLDGAQSKLLEIVGKNPNSGHAWLLLGNISQLKGELGQAAAYYRQAGNLHATGAEEAYRQVNVFRIQPLLQEAEDFQKSDNWTEAFLLYTEAVNIARDSPLAHRKLAEALRHLGDSSRADYEMKKAARLEHVE